MNIVTFRISRLMKFAGPRPPIKAIVWLAIAGVNALAGRADDRELLQQVALTQRANQAAIVTWQGDGVISTQHASSGSGDPTATVNSTLRFALDRRSNRQAFRIDLSTPRTGESPEPTARSVGLLTDELWLHREFSDRVANADAAWQVDSAGSFKFAIDEGSFFPLALLGIGERQAEEVWQTLLQEEVEAWSEQSVARADSLVTVTRTSKIVADVHTRWTFDLAQGGQLTRLESVGAIAQSQWEYEYLQIDGVWLPKSLRYESKSLPSKSDDTTNRAGRQVSSSDGTISIAIQTLSLNRGDVADRMSASFLGVADGQILVDQRSGQYFVVGANHRKPIHLDGLETTGATPRHAVSARRRWVIVGGLILALAGVIAQCIRGFRRGGAALRDVPMLPVVLGLLALVVVGGLAFVRSQAVHSATLRDSKSTTSGQRCAFRMLRRQGIPSAMDVVLKELSRGVEPGLDALIDFLRAQGLEAAARHVLYDQRSRLRPPAIVRLQAPDQYVFVDASPSGELLAFDLHAGRGLVDVDSLGPRWTGQVLECSQREDFVFKPARRQTETPALQFQTLHLDLGRPPPGDQIVYHFPVRNAGKTPLQLHKAYPDCGCIHVEVPQPVLPPGGQGEIIAYYDLRKRKSAGEFQHKITVETNDPVLPYVALTISGNNNARIAIAPSAMEFGQVPGGAPRRRHAVISFHAEDAATGKILSARSSSPQVTAQFEQITTGSPELDSLRLPTLSPLPPTINRWLVTIESDTTTTEANFDGQITLETNLVDYSKIAIDFRGQSTSAISASPPWVVLPSNDGATRPTARVQLWTSDAERPFRLVSVDGGPTDLQFEFDDQTAGSQSWLSILGKTPGEGAGPRAGEEIAATVRFEDGSTETTRITVYQW